jgi:hypothetical protein
MFGLSKSSLGKYCISQSASRPADDLRIDAVWRKFSTQSGNKVLCSHNAHLSPGFYACARYVAQHDNTGGRFRTIKKASGGDLLSHIVTDAVPSALEGLTSVFGMGTGVSPPPLPPESLYSLHLENCTV